MTKKIQVGIIGGAGYTGGELIRLLINHPQVNIQFVHSKSNAGNPVYKVHKDLLGDTDVLFSEDFHYAIDVLFLCMGHGDSKKFLSDNAVPDSIKIIDLANDFRLLKDATLGNKIFVYGLPEINKKHIQTAKNIANPGCFATAIQLGLLPLAQEQLLTESIYTTGITGSTGAGQSLSATSHFSWRANNIQAYKTLTHQHLGEIQQSLHQYQKSFPLIADNKEALNFVPWRGDFTRGIFISSIVSTDISLPTAIDLFNHFYQAAAFTHVSTDPICLKQVINTNKCVISLEKQGGKLVVHSAIDNLLKGASGQAVQNMNLLFGLEEHLGLGLKATGF